MRKKKKKKRASRPTGRMNGLRVFLAENSLCAGQLRPRFFLLKLCFGSNCFL